MIEENYNHKIWEKTEIHIGELSMQSNCSSSAYYPFPKKLKLNQRQIRDFGNTACLWGQLEFRTKEGWELVETCVWGRDPRGFLSFRREGKVKMHLLSQRLQLIFVTPHFPNTVNEVPYSQCPQTSAPQNTLLYRGRQHQSSSQIIFVKIFQRHFWAHRKI